MSKTEYIKGGACLDPSEDAVVKCALEKTECPDPDSFRSSLQVESMGSHPAQRCLTQESVMAINVGRCEGFVDKQICAPNKSACQIHDRFVPDVSLCNVLSNAQNVPQHKYTLYGICRTYLESDDKPWFCSWNRDDCPVETEEHATDWHKYYFEPAIGPHADVRGCACDGVRTGACVDLKGGGTHYCAVSSDACQDGFSYLPVLDFGAQRDSKCFLCREIFEPSTMAPTTAAHYAILNRFEDEDLPSERQSSSDISLSTGAIAGIAVAGAAVIGFVVLGIVWYLRSRALAPKPSDGSTTEGGGTDAGGTDGGGSEQILETEMT